MKRNWGTVTSFSLFLAIMVSWEQWIGYSPIEYAVYPKPFPEVLRRFPLTFLGLFAFVALFVRPKGGSS